VERTEEETRRLNEETKRRTDTSIATTTTPIELTSTQQLVYCYHCIDCWSHWDREQKHRFVVPEQMNLWARREKGYSVRTGSTLTFVDILQEFSTRDTLSWTGSIDRSIYYWTKKPRTPERDVLTYWILDWLTLNYWKEAVTNRLPLRIDRTTYYVRSTYWYWYWYWTVRQATSYRSIYWIGLLLRID
jgi:hypothetical protein